MDIIWIGAAFVLGMLVSKLRLPPLVGYLVAGLALSIYGYEAGSMLEEISNLGKTFLLFTVGLHIRVKNIIAKEVYGVALTHLLITSSIFIPICLYFGYDLTASIIISIVLGFSSTVLTAKTLERRGELGAYYGRVAIGILIIQDLVAIAIVAFTGGGIPSPWSVLILGLPLLRPVLEWFITFLKEDELILLFGLVLAIGGYALFDLFNLSGELGALVMGMLLATDSRADAIAEKMWGIKEAFLVGFFLEIGLIGLPVASEFWFILLAILILPIKSILFYTLFMGFKLRARTGFLSTVTLTAYSEFTLIAGVVAAANGFIPESAVVTLGLITAISYSINAPLTIWEEKIWEKWHDFIIRLERDVDHPEYQPISLGSAEFLIVGMGNAGRAAYDKLKDQDKPVVGMDIDPDRIERNLKAGRRVVYGDIQDTDLWANLELDKIKSVMIAMGNESVKENATKMLRKTGFEGVIYVLTMREEEAEKMQKAGASAISIPIKEAGERLAELSAEIKDEEPSINLKVKKNNSD